MRLITRVLGDFVHDHLGKGIGRLLGRYFLRVWPRIPHARFQYFLTVNQMIKNIK